MGDLFQAPFGGAEHVLRLSGLLHASGGRASRRLPLARPLTPALLPPVNQRFTPTQARLRSPGARPRQRPPTIFDRARAQAMRNQQTLDGCRAKRPKLMKMIVSHRAARPARAKELAFCFVHQPARPTKSIRDVMPAIDGGAITAQFGEALPSPIPGGKRNYRDRNVRPWQNCGRTRHNRFPQIARGSHRTGLESLASPAPGAPPKSFSWNCFHCMTKTWNGRNVPGVPRSQAPRPASGNVRERIGCGRSRLTETGGFHPERGGDGISVCTGAQTYPQDLGAQLVPGGALSIPTLVIGTFC